MHLVARPVLLCLEGSQEVPPVTGDVEEDRDTAVRFGARFTNERDPSSRHPSVRRVEVVDTEKESDPAGCLVADGCHLAFSVCTSEEKTRLRSGRADDHPPLGPAVVGGGGGVLRR